MGWPRTASISSGRMELVSASSTIVTSVAVSAIRRGRGAFVPRVTTWWAMSPIPATRATSSLGRKNGIAEPRSMPAMSGVNPMTMYAAQTGRTTTATMMATASAPARTRAGGDLGMATPIAAARPSTAMTPTAR